MEKLIELLNEHAHTYADHYDDTGEEITIEFYGHTDECFQYTCDGSYETLVDDVVISKRFGFISWLVDNDKIDKHEVHLLWTDDMEYNYSEKEIILMELAIQDNPIEFLLNILK